MKKWRPKRWTAPSLAITGGIASGKSLFGKLLSEIGAEVVDADAVVHMLQRPGQELNKLIVRHFGIEMLDEAGGIDRGSLGKLVFSDKEALGLLENITHPLVREWLAIWRETKTAGWAKVALIPLLFESGWEGDWDLTIGIQCREKDQMRRLRERGLSEGEARSRIAAQWPQERKMEKVDFRIWNCAGIEELARTAELLKKKILESIEYE